MLERTWLGKRRIFFGPNARVFPKGQGWISLVGLLIWAAVSLDGGIGLVGNVPIGELVWDLLAPLNFSQTWLRATWGLCQSFLWKPLSWHELW